ncbi:MAG: hypothetical protein K8R87_12485 [Verrucomicrobia bacterium]|nr:hypothetical protein [Verrucomicrobiota bacterium]
MINPWDYRRILWLLPFVVASGIFAQHSPAKPQLTPLPHPEVSAPIDISQYSSPWLLILICTIAVILLAVVIWLLFRSQNYQTISHVPPLTLAQSRLLELLDKTEKLNPAETGHRVSVIMRDYQLGRYAVPAPFRTREELYDLSQFATDEERRARFASVAQTCDQIAFAPAPATKEEAQLLVHAAIETLRHEVFQSQGAASN